MKKTHYNHHNNHNHHHHHHHHNIHHRHGFSSPLWCWLCLRSFGSKISHFPFSRLVKIQHKIDFQTRRLSSFLKKKQEIMFVFSKTRSVFELLRSYLNLAKVDTIPSSSSIMGVPALLLRESLKKTNIACFCPHFGKLNFSAKLYWLYITIKAKKLNTWHPRGILNRNLFLVYHWPYIKYVNVYDTPKCLLFCGYQLDGDLFGFFYFYPVKYMQMS